MKKAFILLLTSCVLVIACNNDKGKNNTNNNNRETDDYGNKDNDTKESKWSARDVKSFNSDCHKEMGDKLTEDQLDPFCDCLLEKFQDQFSSFAKFNEESTEDDGTAAAKRCMTELGIKKGNGNDNTGTDWSSSDKRQWMNICTSSELVEKFGETKMANYCECILEKMQKRYSSLREADASGGKELGEELGTECAGELRD